MSGVGAGDSPVAEELGDRKNGCSSLPGSRSQAAEGNLPRTPCRRDGTETGWVLRAFITRRARQERKAWSDSWEACESFQ